MHSYRYLSLTLLFTLAWMRPTAAEACSLGFDWADPPAQEESYDAARAPAAPVVTAATVRFYEDSAPAGCGAVSTCGDYAVLTVELGAAPDYPRVRVAQSNGSTQYGMPVLRGDALSFTLAWEGRRGQAPGPIVLEVVSDDGYPSASVDIVPVIEGEDSGCTVTATRSSGGALLLIAAVLLATRRRGARRAA